MEDLSQGSSKPPPPVEEDWEERLNKLKKQFSETTDIQKRKELEIRLKEYDFVYEKRDDFRRGNQPRIIPTARNELRDLTTLLYCGSLFNVNSSREEWKASNKSTNKERKTFQDLNKEDKKIEFSSIGKISREMTPLLSSTKDTHASRLSACTTALIGMSFESSEYAELRELIHAIDKSDYMNSLVSDQISGEPSKKKQWLGGTLQNWIDENGKEATIKLTCRIANDVFEEARLSNVGRYIIRGMMKKTMKLHQQGTSHCSLNLFTIFVDDKYDVQLGDNQYRPASQKNMREDCLTLKIIIKAILGDNIPNDVSHLLRLIDNYSSDKHDLIFNHSCLWTPTEMISNIFLFRLMLDTCPPEDATRIKHVVGEIEEQQSDWTYSILRIPAYKRAFDAWIQEAKAKRQRAGGDGGDEEVNEDGPHLSHVSAGDVQLLGRVGILTFMRMSLVHVHQHKEKALLSRGIGGEKRPLFMTEKELYLVFPLYIPHFLENTRREQLITDIYKSDS